VSEDSTTRVRPTIHPVKSGMLTGVGYDPASRTLAVQYTNGGIYHYHGIEQTHVDDLLAAESLGKHFLIHIRNAGFEATRIEDDKETPDGSTD
jgi:hypothetical protein